MNNFIRVGVSMASMLVAISVMSVNAQAQVLGGSLTGGLGGTLSGGMRDVGAMAQGGGNGSLGGRFDTSGLDRATRLPGRATERVRETAGTVRDRSASTVQDVKASTTSTATNAGSTVQGAARSAAQVANQGVTQTAVVADAAGSLTGSANATPGSAQTALNGAGTANLSTLAQPLEENASPTTPASDGTPIEALQTPSSTAEPSAPLTSAIGGSGEGSANGSASRDGIAIDAGANANGSASASVQR